MSELGDKLRNMADDVMGFMLGAAEDVEKGDFGWAQVALDEASTALGKMVEMVDEAESD